MSLYIVQQQLVRNLLDRSLVVCKNSASIGMTLGNSWQHLFRNLAHSVRGRKLCHVRSKGIDGSWLHSRHYFGVEGSGYVENVDAWKNLAHRVDECLYQSKIVSGMSGVDGYCTC